MGRRGGKVRRSAVFVVALAMVVPGVASSSSATDPAAQARAMQRLEKARSLGASEGLRIKAGSHLPERRRSRVADLIAASGDPRSPATLAASARALTEQAWGITLPDPRERIAALGKEAQGGHVDTDEGYILRYGLPGGDLTGDGLHDAISIDIDLGAFTFGDLHALRGTDGSELWSMSMDDAYEAWAYPVGDMTGDGAEDLLVTSFVVTIGGTGTCALLACAIAGAYTLAWHHRLVSGPDGAVVWTKTYEGEQQDSLLFLSALVAYGYAYEVTATNALVVAAPSGDHDGDGATDLVFNSFDVTGLYALAGAGAFVAGADVEVPLILIDTTGELLSGADSAILYERNEGYKFGANMLMPSGDSVGDGTPDLLWETFDDAATPAVCAFVVLGTCLGAVTSSLSVTLVDGATLQDAWTRTVDDGYATYTFIESAHADLDGDGKEDLLVDDWWDYEVHALSGDDGQTLWSRTGSSYPIVIGQVGGAPGHDVITVEVFYEFDEETLEEIITVTPVRLDGANGDELFRTSRIYASEGWVDVYLYLPGDNDEDGITDLAFDVLVFDPDAFEITSSELDVESGATGTSIYSRAVDTITVSLPAGNFDAAGGDDLLDVTITFADDVTDLRFDGVALPAGTTAWSRTDRYQGYWDLLLVTTPDQVGDGGDDTIYDRLQEDYDSFSSRIDSIDGRSGALRWGRGPAFPPIVARGAITGTVTNDEGDPLSFMCVDVYAAETFDFRGWDYTSVDGTYRVGGLDAGDHKVEFYDCDLGEYGEEWYDDRPSFEEADPVQVTQGTVVGGIDAQLANVAGPPPVGDPPPHDDFEDAELLEQRPSSTLSSTDGATMQQDEPRMCGLIGSTVWYRYTPVDGGPVTMTTVGSDYDTVLAIYSGEELGDLSLLACNDDIGPTTLQSAMTVVLEAGETYYVQAGGYGGNRGTLRLSAV